MQRETERQIDTQIDRRLCHMNLTWDDIISSRHA